MGSDHDQTFLHILREEKNISNFLDAFFGFLYRCTDFYVEANLEQKLGFPPGVAETCIKYYVQVEEYGIFTKDNIVCKR